MSFVCSIFNAHPMVEQIKKIKFEAPPARARKGLVSAAITPCCSASSASFNAVCLFFLPVNFLQEPPKLKILYFFLFFIFQDYLHVTRCLSDSSIFQTVCRVHRRGGTRLLLV